MFGGAVKVGERRVWWGKRRRVDVCCHWLVGEEGRLASVDSQYLSTCLSLTEVYVCFIGYGTAILVCYNVNQLLVGRKSHSTVRNELMLKLCRSSPYDRIF
jgi:hypothetical protein